jgi:hypothetical protein
VTALAVALIGLVGVLALAGASVYNARFLPTLDRRAREHVTLVKDMPDSIAEPLRNLLAEEVDNLVARERARLTSAPERCAGRIHLLLAALGFLAALGVLVLPQSGS